MSAPLDVLAVIEDKFGAGEIVAAVQELAYYANLAALYVRDAADAGLELRECPFTTETLSVLLGKSLAKFGGAA